MSTYSLTTSVGPNAKRTGSNFTAYGTAAVTVMAWVKTSTDNTTAMVANVNDGTLETFQIIKVGNNYRFDVSAGGSTGTSSNIAEGSIENGVWNHIAGVYTGANVQIFLNGVQQGSNVAKTGNLNTSNPTRLGIGVRSTGADLPFVGEIDDVKVFNIALDAATISSYMADCSFSPTTSGLTGWWKLDNNDVDSQTNITANDLVSVGSPSFTTDPAYTCSVTTIKTWNGISRANLKSLNGTLSANIKTINGIT